jgi:hypothetical protein
MGKRRELIKRAVKESAWKSINKHLKHAHDLERIAPGAGEMYLRRLTVTLDGLLDAELRKLRTSQDGEAR